MGTSRELQESTLRITSVLEWSSTAGFLSVLGTMQVYHSNCASFIQMRGNSCPFAHALGF